MEETKLIDIEHVYAGYDNTMVLKDVNLEIYDKDFIGVIGPNGGGKTTLLKLMLGLLKPSRGKIHRYTSISSGIGYLPQYSEIDRKFPITVRNVVLSGAITGKKFLFKHSRKQKQRADELMQQMGIAYLKNKPIGELSGGQLQRAFLCRALVSDPSLLILDEPNTFVDNAFEGELYEILRELNRYMAIVMVSHDVGIISPYVKTIACVNETLHYHPSNKITQQQLATYNCPIQLLAHGDVPHTVIKKHR
ncbi:MAG: ABC transporter ATP-binding protein [Bacteroidales bacterium]|nr:ABC transporter ATP-binding protein [Bacteroidales bacterium]MCF8332967.1 ABC transporter ATP-binding protein [Bacteroidales bacterium]